MFGVLLTMRWDVHRDHGNTFRAIEPSPKQILSAGRDANCKLRRDSDVCVCGHASRACAMQSLRFASRSVQSPRVAPSA